MQVEEPRTIITRNKSPDISFDRSINPYRGCEHGCVYCFARPTHAYMGLSPGSTSRPSCSPSRMPPRCSSGAVRTAISRAPSPSAPTPIPTSRSSGTADHARDPGGAGADNHPVGIVTKSALVVRDIDILARMAERGLAKVALSVTTLDRPSPATMEPRAATPTKRLEAIRPPERAGVPTR